MKKLSELNPKLVGKQLTIDCPLCKEAFSIDVNYQGDPISPATWGLKHPEGIFNWDTVTITPSINLHPQSRKKQKCQAHFSIINGTIV